MALAGYSKDDVIVEYENNQRTIKSKPYPKDEEKEDTQTIHKGIAKRYFSKVITIADDVEVKGAELKDCRSEERSVGQERKVWSGQQIE